MFEIAELIDGIKYLANNGDLNADTVKRGILNFTNPNSASIMKRARANICQFPLLVSNSLPADDYNEVAIMLERLYATYIRMTIVNNSEIIDLQNKESVGTLLRNIHQNDYANYGFENTEQIVSKVSEIFNESYLFKISEKSKIGEINKELLKPYLENFNMNSLCVYTEAPNTHRPNNHNRDINDDIEYLRRHNDISSHHNRARTIVDEYSNTVYMLNSLYEKDHNFDSRQAQELNQRLNNLDNLINDSIVNGTANLNDEDYENLRHSINVIDNLRTRFEQNSINTSQLNNKELQNQLYSLQIEELINKNKNFKQYAGKVTTDIQIKKNNELEPSILEIELYYNNGNTIQNTKVAIGVKCISHLIPYEELCYFIPDCLIKKKPSFKFIQFTTGEIKFVKDFILDLDNTKFEATTEKESVRWWRHLHSRSNASRIRGALNPKQPLIPNASIVLSMQDIEFIRIKDHIDLFNKNKNMVTKLLHYYFLINFVVVDSADNMIYLWNEDSSDWERYTFKQLDKETQDSMKRNNRISLR